MRFDPDLARKILIDLEDAPPVTSPGEIVLEGHSRDEISYHIKTLHQDNLIEAVDVSGFGSFHWKVKSLTSEGHRFLDAIKNDTLWSKIKALAKTEGIQFTIAAMKGIVADYVKKKSGLG